MKKILFFIRSLEGGGAEKVLIDYLNGLEHDNHSYKITVLALYNAGIYIDKLPKDIEYKFIIKKPSLNKRRIVDRLLKYLPSTFLRKLFIRNSYEVEISFMEGNQSKLISAAPNSVKKILWIHTDVTKLRKSDFLSAKDEKSCYEQFDVVVCVSNIVALNLKKKISDLRNVVTIYNPLNKKKIMEYKHKEYFEKNSFNDTISICSVGRLVRDKRFDRLVNAIAYLKSKNFNVSLSIFGDGVEKKALSQLIEQLQLNDVVVLEGFKDDIFRYLSNYDLFVCSSENEGFSLAVVEAMILGLPIIATEGTGAAEIIGNGKYGYLAENSTEGVIQSVYTFLCNNDFKKYHELAEIRSKDFDMEKSIFQLKEILK